MTISDCSFIELQVPLPQKNYRTTLKLASFAISFLVWWQSRNLNNINLTNVFAIVMNFLLLSNALCLFKWNLKQSCVNLAINRG